MLRWGIVGFGDIAAKAVAPAIRAHAASELVAICRRDPVALEHHRQAFDVPRAFTDYDEMLRQAPIDAVYVATPVHLHAAQTLAALDRGLHVLVEKPMAATEAEAEAMVNAPTNAACGWAWPTTISSSRSTPSCASWWRRASWGS